MDKLKMSTPDLTDKNIEQIGALFPNVITETRDENGVVKKAVDFDLLRQMLSKNLVEDDNERYRLDWPGKKASLLKANTPITKTLRPCREESVNFDTTENLYIEGDNFEVLKILQESYLGKIKMIYIDPPYNTGNDFIYKDNFAKSKDEYEEELGTTDEEGGRLFRNTDSNGRYHSDWLSMMYERLIVARDLLKDDGVIFISIDDNEVHNLRKICDEIFGEGNFVTNIIWQKKYRPQNDAVNFSQNHDFIICIAKNRKTTQADSGWKRNLIPRSAADVAAYTNPDSDSRGPWQSSGLMIEGVTANCVYDIVGLTGKVFRPDSGKRWSVSKDTFEKLSKEKRIWFGKNGDAAPRVKRYLSEVQDGIVPSSIFLFEEVGHTGEGKKDFMSLFKEEVFSYPKPLRLILRLLTIAVDKNEDLVLDFFSGSATTAHAVMQLNAEDGGNRKFIMVQIPEPCDENSEAYKAGYKTIAEIGKERIRRAGKRLNLDSKGLEDSHDLLLSSNHANQGNLENHGSDNLDIGFRVYKVDSTNMKDVFYHPSELKQDQLSFLESNIKEDRTPEDLLTQVILDLGLELTLPIETKQILGNTVFIVQTNALVACFDKDIDFNIVDTISDLKPLKVVFKDASFKDDKDRINVEERFKRLSPETKVTVI